jgi:hypothetical protein
MSAWRELKIQQMYGAQPASLSAAELPRFVHDLQTMSPLHGLQIFPDAAPALDGHWQYPCMSIGWHREGQGYVVQCSETAYSGSCLLATSRKLSEPEIYIEFDGQGQELWPKQLYASYEAVLQAIDHFLATGLQNPQLAWIGLGDFPRRPVAPRPRLR